MRASEVAIEIAKSFHSDLLVLSVVAIPFVPLESPAGAGASSSLALQQYYDNAAKESQKILDAIVDNAKKQGVNAVSVIAEAMGSVVQTIVNKSNTEKVDLIVIGTRGLGTFSRLIQGSVSSGIVTHAHCNVLVVR